MCPESRTPAVINVFCFRLQDPDADILWSLKLFVVMLSLHLCKSALRWRQIGCFSKTVFLNLSFNCIRSVWFSLVILQQHMLQIYMDWTVLQIKLAAEVRDLSIYMSVYHSMCLSICPSMRLICQCVCVCVNSFACLHEQHSFPNVVVPHSVEPVWSLYWSLLVISGNCNNTSNTPFTVFAGSL